MPLPAQSRPDQLRRLSDGARIIVAAAVIALLLAAAYSNSFRGAWVYDDFSAVVRNASLESVSRAWAPPTNGSPVSGRPLVNVSFAANVAVGGLNPVGFHLANILIHFAATLALFGVIRRTLLLARWRQRFAGDSTMLATMIATVWCVHPLQTESVTYVAQRSEALMGFCYLLTLYTFIRSVDSPRAGWWQIASIATCAAGMASKEVMVSAPIFVLIFDRTLVAGSFATAWRQRGRYYAGLAASWFVLAGLVVNSGNRAGTAGFGTVSWWTYALAQCHSIAVYLKLALWPAPLVFDYGVETPGVAEVIWGGALVGAIAVATWVMRRKIAPGALLSVWFLLILAPTSSVLPIVTETMAEHRMYLPLIGPVAVAIFALHAVVGRRVVFASAMATVLFAGLTWHRNLDYRGEKELWRDTVAKRPGNPRARFNFAVQLAEAGDATHAIAEYEAALRLRPNFASAHINLANLMVSRGNLSAAEEHASTALRIDPAQSAAHNALGNVRLQRGDVTGALAEYESALRLAPDNADVRNNLATALTRANRLTDALHEYEIAVRQIPGSALVQFNIANTLARLGRFAEAIPHYEAVLQIRADYPRARENLERVRILRAQSPGR
jgi:Tfp pilus assembly protein PilF